jgi:hypothetical protein
LHARTVDNYTTEEGSADKYNYQDSVTHVVASVPKCVQSTLLSGPKASLILGQPLRN